MNLAIDWNAARATSARLARSGKPPRHLAATVEQIRAVTVQSRHLAAQTAAITAPPEPTPVLVVDRAGWAAANIATFAQLLDPILAGVEVPKAPPGWIGGAQLGAGLAALSSRVLGQFDPFSGRLLMVAPNILAAEQRMQARPRDFRRWVAIHEQTHALQFAAAPFLADLLREGMTVMVSGLLRRATTSGGLAFRIPRRSSGGSSGARENIPAPLRAILDEEGAAWLDRLTGVMALLEGHAEVVMDDVGPAQIPTVTHLRAGLQQRRSSGGLFQIIARRILGLDAKLAQYERGAQFVRAVTAAAGPAGFAQVWTSPQTFPTWAEITDPDAWIRRVL